MLVSNIPSKPNCGASYHVLSERLCKAGTEALLDEMTERKGVLVGIAGSEALVGHVKEGVVVTLLDSLSNLQPLLLGRVNAGGIVSTGVKQHDAVLGHGLDIGDHAIKVKADGVLVVVPVLLNLEARVLEHSRMVRPRWGGDVDGLRVRVVALEEGTTNAKSAGTGDGLGDGNTVLSERS